MSRGAWELSLCKQLEDLGFGGNLFLVLKGSPVGFPSFEDKPTFQPARTVVNAPLHCARVCVNSWTVQCLPAACDHQPAPRYVMQPVLLSSGTGHFCLQLLRWRSIPFPFAQVRPPLCEIALCCTRVGGSTSKTRQ